MGTYVLKYFFTNVLILSIETAIIGQPKYMLDEHNVLFYLVFF